jgi:(p)ppGpp synthase/HD superfamily hydrolase
VDDLVGEARSFATRVHKGQIRRNKAQEPFIVHAKEVASLVEESGGSNEEIAAAWLHDSVEDTPTSLEDIIKYFGLSVGAIVSGLTDPLEFNGLHLSVRKKRQAERIRSMSDSIKLIKIADQTSNTRAVAVDPPVKWNKQKCLDYIEGARLIVNECQGISEFLSFQFHKAYTDAFKAHS